MGPADRPLRSHRGTILIFLGIRPNPNSLREFLVHRFNRIDVLVAKSLRLVAEKWRHARTLRVTMPSQWCTVGQLFRSSYRDRYHAGPSANGLCHARVAT